MENSQKTIGIGFVMAGVLCIILPIFMNNSVLDTIGKPIGYVLTFIGVIYLIAGDQLLKLGMKLFQREKYQKLREMTPEQIIELKRKEHNLKMQEMKDKLEIEKAKAEIEKIKYSTAKLRESSSSKIDVLGNLDGFLVGTKKKKDDDSFNDLKKLF